MGNETNYLHTINFVNLFNTLGDQENPKKLGCDSFQKIFTAAFLLY